MELTAKMLVLGINHWVMDDGKEGYTLFYVPTDSVNTTEKRGLFPVKASIKIEAANELEGVSFPAVVDAKMTLASNVGNNMTVEITGFVGEKKTINIFK